jgi:hypothetical protein
VRPRNRSRVLGAVLVLSASAMQGARAQPAIREHVIGVRPDGVVPHSVTISQTGRLAYVARSAAGDALVVDGVVGPTYAAIPTPPWYAGLRLSLVFSPDGNRYAHNAKKGDRWVAVVDGAEGPVFDQIVNDHPFFSADSRHVAYIGVRDGKARVVLDNVEGPPYDRVQFVSSLAVFADGSQRVYYVGHRAGRSYLVVDGREVVQGEQISRVVYNGARDRFACVVKKGERWAVVVDGVEGKAYREIGQQIVFSKDGRRWMYIARDSLHHAVIDGVETGGYASIVQYGFGFSESGEHVAFQASDGDKSFWVLDGQPQKSYQRIEMANAPMFSPDGTRLTYVTRERRERGRAVLVIGTWESEPFDWIIGPPYFRPDGRVVYTAGRDGKVYVGVDSTTTVFDHVGWIYPAENRRVVYPARRGASWYAVIDGVLSPAYSDSVTLIAISRNGQRVAYEAGRAGKRFVVVDGIEGPPYDSVRFLDISADGRRVRYAGKRLGKWVLVADGVESPPYDELLRPPHPVSLYGLPLDAVPKSSVMIGRRGRTDIRVTVDWPRR